jgi:putative nucleotidyltransferase with HDIG domain
LSFLGISITYLELLIGIIIGILVAIAFLFKAIFMLNTYLPVAITLILTALLYPYIRLLFLKKKIDFEELKEIIQSIQLSSILNIIKKKLQIKDAYFIFNPDEQLIKLFLSKRKPLTFLDIALSFNKETQINPQIEDKLYKLNMYAGVPLFTSNTHTSNNKLLGLLILGKRIGLRVYDDISLYYLAKLSQDLAYLIERKLFYFFKITNTLIKEIETRDKSLYEHCQGVAEYSDKIGKKLGLTKDMLEKLKISAYLHDIGKLGINQKILNKPAKLTKEEFEQVKKHTIIGYDLIKAEFEEEKIILQGVRHHHERLDGLGYPDGLKEKDIPLWVRILTVADAYQAMN